MENKLVKVHSCTLAQLFEAEQSLVDVGIKGQLCIPEYQRPYVWEQKQINRLLNDLHEHNTSNVPDKPLFYLGTIILHQTHEALNIIDGQQRITTMLLLNKFKAPNFKSGIEYKSSSSIENIKRNVSYLKAVFEKDIYEFRDNTTIENLDFSKINVTLVVTSTEDLAYTFFETQNTGGVRLSGGDIVKAHHLRAIEGKKMINHQARRWEQIEKNKVESIMQYLCKVRYWDNRNWRKYPFYRDERGIKSELIDEFTERTLKNKEDVSYYYSAVKAENGRLMQMYESHFKQLKQPLSDGNNAMNYINEYIELYDMLFNPQKRDYRISDELYLMVEKMMHGQSGTIFLKELLEIAIVAYVSRFGFYRLYESALWLYRFVYSMRVSSGRNVREDSVFKTVYDNQFIDNILEVHTVEQLHHYLKKYSYEFNKDHTEPNQSKDKHLQSLKAYFGVDAFREIKHYADSPKEFDKHLMSAISKKISSTNE